MKLNKKELLNINGGAVSVTASLVSSILDIVNVVIDLGRSIGASIKKITTKNSCEV